MAWVWLTYVFTAVSALLPVVWCWFVCIVHFPCTVCGMGRRRLSPYVLGFGFTVQSGHPLFRSPPDLAGMVGPSTESVGLGPCRPALLCEFCLVLHSLNAFCCYCSSRRGRDGERTQHAVHVDECWIFMAFNEAIHSFVVFGIAGWTGHAKQRCRARMMQAWSFRRNQPPLPWRWPLGQAGLDSFSTVFRLNGLCFGSVYAGVVGSFFRGVYTAVAVGVFPFRISVVLYVTPDNRTRSCKSEGVFAHYRASSIPSQNLHSCQPRAADAVAVAAGAGGVCRVFLFLVLLIVFSNQTHIS